LNTVAVSNWLFKFSSSLPEKPSRPQKTPGLAEFELSLWPCNGSSNFSQNLIESIILTACLCFFWLPRYVYLYLIYKRYSTVQQYLLFQAWPNQSHFLCVLQSFYAFQFFLWQVT
jgi:hypothetical protein